MDIPTDCPHREKAGWTGDAQVYIETATYLADILPFFRKWLKDVRDCQNDDGRVTNVCPKVVKPGLMDALNGSVGWADAAVIIPYTLWKVYGDENCITDNYDLMRGWKEYVIMAAADKSIYNLPENHQMKPMEAVFKPFLLPDSPYNKYIIESGLHWGEWAEPGVDLNANGHLEIIKPKQEITAAYMYYSMTLLEEMFQVIGKTEEAAECREYAEGAKQGYNFHFVRDNQMNEERQAPYVRALALGLLDGDAKKNTARRLNDMVIANEYKVGTGFLSTKFILQVLTENGYPDTAYKMLENTNAPGWLAMVEHGATTVWENYDIYDEAGNLRATSLNHYSLGAVCGFLFDTVCGIKVAGSNKFRIAPVPGGNLTFADGEYDSTYGRVKSSWKENGGGYVFHIEIPPNTSAEVCLPSGEHHQVQSGVYQYSY